MSSVPNAGSKSMPGANRCQDATDGDAEGGAAVASGAEGPLGTNTVIGATDCDAVNRDRAAEERLLRYELQRVVQKLAPYEHRVRVCLVCRVPTEEYIRVLQTSKGSGRLGGLMVCALPWLCPVCAVVIGEKRRDELTRTLAWWRSQGGVVFMSTFTRSHSKDEPLRASWDALNAAYRWVCKHRDYRSLCERVGLQHSVRGSEVTWGVLNGWHPHLHVLQLVARRTNLDAFKDELRQLWAAAASKFGFEVSSERGVNVVYSVDAVATYVAKWDRLPTRRPWEGQDELTKGHSKRARGVNFTPFDLLRRMVETGETWPAPLFQEFADASYRRHQLQWSRGLKKAAGLADLSDQELAERIEDEARVLALLTDRDYQAVRFYHQVGQLVELARSGDAGVVKAFVMTLNWRFDVEVARGRAV